MILNLVTLMILLAEICDEKEFIFPEITALTIGAWLAPKTNKFKLVLLIAIHATLGIVLVKYIKINIYFKFISVCFML